MKHKADIGRCKIAKHRIEVEPDAIPHREGARRMSPEKAEKANNEVHNLLALGMIQPSFSPWASGIVMVKKKGGELRFCCDFRPLNDVTIKDAYPLPRIDESLSRLGNARVFEWRRMPFGLCNASATFQRAIARALARIKQRHGSMVMAYIDDIVIATETVEDHLERIKEVLQCLREAGFKMRAAKCDFMRTETKYFGRVVSAEGIKPDPDAVIKVQNWIAPRSKEELQSFLGFANYYREFVPFYAEKAEPLNALLRKNLAFNWNERAEKAFVEVKEGLMSATALAAPNETGRFVLDTDASAVAIAGILHQEQEHEGRTILRPIHYGSKTLSQTQMKYGAPKLEMFAAYYFVDKFHSYLAPRKFILRVDNQALSWLKTYSMDMAMIGRWISKLDQYHFEIVHRPRTKHRNADGLSKRSNDYLKREKLLEAAPEHAPCFSFMTQQDYDQLPIVPWLNKQGQPILTHPDLPTEYKIEAPLLSIRSKQSSDQDNILEDATEIGNDCWFPETVWENSVPLSDNSDIFSCTHCMKIDVEGPQASSLQSVQQVKNSTEINPHSEVLALLEVSTELHEHISTVHPNC